VPQPVVHFDIIGQDPARLREYYAGLFGWTFDTPSPVAAEVSDRDGYGFLDLISAQDGTGIRGGVGGGAGAVTKVTATRNSWGLDGKCGMQVMPSLARRR